MGSSMQNRALLFNLSAPGRHLRALRALSRGHKLQLLRPTGKRCAGTRRAPNPARESRRALQRGSRGRRSRGPARPRKRRRGRQPSWTSIAAAMRPPPACTGLLPQAARACKMQRRPGGTPQPGTGQADDGVTSPLNGRSLGAHRRPPAATGSMFRPVPPVPRYLRRASAAQPAPNSQAVPEGAPAAAAEAAAVPEADQSAAAPSEAAAYTSEQSPSGYVLLATHCGAQQSCC